MIAASRMRRAQERNLQGRPYDEKIRQVISDLAALPRADGAIHPLLERRPVEKIAIVHITSDRGLCGGLNTNVNRRTANFSLEQAKPTVLITVGRKGRDFMYRYGQNVRAEFTNLGDKPRLFDTLPISRIVIDDYTNKLVDMVYLSFAQFVTTMSQRPILKQLLPVEPAQIPARENVDYLYEPAPGAVLAQLLPRFVEMQVYHAILESIASEQSARMVAMRSATDNAMELVQDLTLVYNKARQEMITTELLAITLGASALE